MSADGIPFLDLAGQHAEIADQLDEAWAKVTSTNGFIGGAYVAAFEAEYAKFCGASECIGVANGTDAIELILRGLGIGPGDEVIVPANTFVATVEAVVEVGATPVFVDVADDTLLVTRRAHRGRDHADAPRPRSSCTSTVRCPTWTRSARSPTKAGIALIEDAAQAQGAAWRDRPGRLVRRRGASFSFYPGKNLGAFGDAGAITTERRRADATRSARYGDHGRRARHQARARVLRVQQPPRRAPGRDPLDQARAPRRLERRAAGPRPTTTASSSRAPTVRVLARRPEATPVLPPRDRSGRRPRRPSPTRSTRTESDGASTTRFHAINRDPFTRFAHGPCMITEKRRRRDPLGSDVPDDHPSRSRASVRDTGGGRPRERRVELEAESKAPADLDRSWTPVSRSRRDRRGRDVPVEAAAAHQAGHPALLRDRRRDRDRLPRARRTS